MSERPLHNEEREPSMEESEKSFVAVSRNLQEHLASLKEAVEIYPQVTLPNGETVDPANDAERILGKIQLVRAYIEGELEKNAESMDLKQVREMEVVLRMVEQFIKRLEEFLAILADLVNMGESKGKEGAEELADTLRTMAKEFLSDTKSSQE